MDEEIAINRRNETWDFVYYLNEKEVIGVKWVYKTKYAPNWSLHNHKARLVEKGFVQKLGIYYDETYVLVSSLNTIIIFLALESQYKCLIY